MTNPDIDEETLRRAVEEDDHDAMRDVLRTCNVPSSAIDKCLRGLRRGRARDKEEREKRVVARIHYVKRGWLHMPKRDRIAELIELFELPENIAQYIANSAYPDVNAEAERRIQAETEANM